MKDGGYQPLFPESFFYKVENLSNKNKGLHPYLSTLAERIIAFDGAMGTNLEARGLTGAHFGSEKYNGCNDHLNLSCPEAVRQVHRSFLQTGVDVIETNIFRQTDQLARRSDLAQQELLFKLLPAEEELGLRMTSAWQFIPEYATDAMVVHHPAASYFCMAWHRGSNG